MSMIKSRILHAGPERQPGHALGIAGIEPRVLGAAGELGTPELAARWLRR
jgi:hypothetical protein